MEAFSAGSLVPVPKPVLKALSNRYKRGVSLLVYLDPYLVELIRGRFFGISYKVCVADLKS
jgi:hypothetical protein